MSTTLWIMSQNEENLVQVTGNVQLKYSDKCTIIANYIPDFTDNYDGYYEVLGTYKNSERAKAVLREIRSLIGGCICKAVNDGCTTYYSSNVYDMPKE